MPRKHEEKIEISAPADAVWKAIAEARGIESWFAPEARVEPGVDGKIWISWGPECEGESHIETWEPGRKLRYSYDRPDGRGPNVVDFTIEAQSGDRTILTMVNSGFGDDASFDGELETTSHAWGLFLYLLKHGIEQRYGTCKNVMILKMIPLPHHDAFRQITAGLATAQRYFDPFGEACYDFPGIPGAVVAIFCEPARQASMITVMGILYDSQAAEEATARSVVESLFENVQATATGGA